ncbi:DUF262 domain-containing protein [Novosphingobium sp. NPDC080210]|uniref:DUF262 domain-containing protein n=1 Tax=Novosphingobium sp. NPDC080210 TaxID=3390596 RepID=UPI003D02449E
MYREDELIINPEYQRLFRWDQTAKTRFIESLLLGIPIPPIFVFQDENGVWELIDGLQRLSTVFQFVGVLEGEKAQQLGPLVLEGTNYLPSLANKRWEQSGDGAGDGIGQAQQLQIKRARIRVEILKRESDPKAKYELFQRLNTGGARLTEQEVRNCVAVMINPDFHAWLMTLSELEPFVKTTQQTSSALEGQAGVELVLRYLAYLNVSYERGLDVHEYLDSALISLASNQNFDRIAEEERFKRTFTLLHAALGQDAFKRWDGEKFQGKFLISVYEVLAPGVAKNIDAIEALGDEASKEFVRKKASALWANETFQKSSGGGTRGTTRLVNLLPMSEDFMKPE